MRLTSAQTLRLEEPFLDKSLQILARLQELYYIEIGLEGGRDATLNIISALQLQLLLLRVL